MTRFIIIIVRFLKKISRDHVRAYAAESSFFLIMSAVPFLMMFLSLIQYAPLTPEQMMEVMGEFLPPSLLDVFQPVIVSIYNQNIALLSTTAIAAMWIASKGVLAMSDGLNSVFGITETRGYITIHIRAIIHTIFLMGALLAAFSLLTTGNQAFAKMMEFLPLSSLLQRMVFPMRMLLMLALLILLFICLYKYLPNEERHFRDQIPGALFTAVSWWLFSIGFSLYLRIAKNMSLLYGGLTTLIIVMLWIYFYMTLFFYGAEINCYREDSRRF